MFDILAQVKDILPVAGFGAGGVGVISLWLVKRKFNKICDHVDDTTKHIDPQNGYVRKSMCEVLHSDVVKELQETKASIIIVSNDIKEILKRTDHI